MRRAPSRMRKKFRPHQLMPVSENQTVPSVERPPSSFGGSSGGVGPPRHPVHRDARHRVLVLAGVGEAVLFVEADGAEVILVDQQLEAGGRDALGFLEQRKRYARTPLLG